ncbi:MAG: queuosine precursor transporter, partial [Anaerolineaceae bacterium]|nr:queuosine precursor transporter [Anaerolineaceae bacterium]
VQPDFAQVLSPVWRIVIASIVAEIIAEFIDTEGYRLWTEKVTKKYQWSRVLVSNAVSIPVDSLLFCWIAFGGVLPTSVVWAIFGSNVLVKGITTLISLPGIYIVKERPQT